MWKVTNGRGESMTANDKINAIQIGIIKTECGAWDTYFVEEE